MNTLHTITEPQWIGITLLIIAYFMTYRLGYICGVQTHSVVLWFCTNVVMMILAWIGVCLMLNVSVVPL